MGRYTIRGLLLAIPVLLGILIITFVLARVLPGTPCDVVLSDKATQDACDRVIQAWGLDKPLSVQFLIYIKDLARGDFGDSLRYNRPAIQILVERIQRKDPGIVPVVG